MQNNPKPGSPGTIQNEFPLVVNGRYIFTPLNDEVVCVHVDPKEKHIPNKVRYATFEFFQKVAAFHHVPFTIPENLWPAFLKPNEFPL